MFNLDQAIAEWRRQLIAAGITSTEVLDELESHLREDLEQRLRSGLNPQQAFDAAVEKLGEIRALKSEFVKTVPPKQPVRPAVLRVGGVIMAVFILMTNTWILFADDLNPIQRAVALWFVIAATWVLFMGASRRSVLPVLNTPRGAAIAKFIFLFVAVWPLVAVCSLANLFHFRIGFTAEMFIWNLFALCTVATLWSVYFYPESFDVLTATPWSFGARQSFAIAHAEASDLYHDFIGTEHLLLGLLKSEPRVPDILKKLGVNDDAVRSEIRKLVEIGPAHEISADIPLTPRARKALQLAAEEAKSWHHSSPGAEHVFLGLLREGSGVAAVALKNLGVRLEKAREIISNEWL